MLSGEQLKVADLYDIHIANVKKIVPNFLDKENYVLHNDNLQIYWKLGLKLKTIHRVLEFNQSQWLKPYTEFNPQKRREAKKMESIMEKHCHIKYWKNNAMYGKTKET